MRNRVIATLFMLIFTFMVPRKSVSSAVPVDSVQEKHETAATRILRHTSIYLTEAFGGFMGGCSGSACGEFVWTYAIRIAYACGFIEHGYAHYKDYRKVYYISMPVGVAMGTHYIGEFWGKKGSLTGALIGSVIGTIAGVALSKCSSEYEYPCPSEWWGASVGATMGYNYKEILKCDPYSIRGVLLHCVISCALPYLMHHLTTVGLW